MLDKIRPYAKAVLGFITPGVVALVASVQESSPAGTAITGAEWISIGAACILTGGIVYGVPNKDKDTKARPTALPYESSN